MDLDMSKGSVTWLVYSFEVMVSFCICHRLLFILLPLFALVIAVRTPEGIDLVLADGSLLCATLPYKWYQDTVFLECVEQFRAYNTSVSEEIVSSIANMKNLIVLSLVSVSNMSRLPNFFANISVTELTLSGLGMCDGSPIPASNTYDLTRNRFTSIPVAICANGAVTLAMSWNEITHVPHCSFSSISTGIDLSHNNITSVDPFIFLGGAALYIDLSYNLLVNVSLPDPSLMRHVDLLDLSHNRIENVLYYDGNITTSDSYWFSGRFLHLDLSYNRLSGPFFAGNLLSAVVDLSSNDLSIVNIGGVIGAVKASSNPSLRQIYWTEGSSCSLVELDDTYVLYTMYARCPYISARNCRNVPMIPDIFYLRNVRTLLLDGSTPTDNASVSLASIIMDTKISVLGMSNRSIASELSTLFFGVDLHRLESMSSLDLDRNGIYGVMNTTVLVNDLSGRVTLRNNPLSCVGLSKWCASMPLYDGTGECFPCVDRCGNGLRFGVEQCDDGNRDDGDCCSSSCTIELMCTCSEKGQDKSIPYIHEDPSTCTRDVGRKSADLVYVALIVFAPAALLILVALITFLVVFHSRLHGTDI